MKTEQCIFEIALDQNRKGWRGEGAEDARDFFYLSLEKDKRKKKMK